jgi:hypothetical protein
LVKLDGFDMRGLLAQKVSLARENLLSLGSPG